MDEKTLRVEDEAGNTFDYEILFTYTSEKFNKSFVVLKEQGDSNEVFAYQYNEEDATGGRLLPVETDEEWDEIEEKLEEYAQEDDE
jgi:uncharacterized protein YrzB (UPF0473 family)